MVSARTPRRVTVVALALAALAPACATGNAATEPGDDTRAAAPSTASTLADAPPDPDSYTEPPDDLQPDDTQFAFGQEIVITDTQFVPLQLVSRVDTDVTIRNDTDSVKEVRFINGPADEASGATSTGPIPPGGAFVFHPVAQRSLTYQLADDPAFRAALFIDVADYVP